MRQPALDWTRCDYLFICEEHFIYHLMLPVESMKIHGLNSKSSELQKGRVGVSFLSIDTHWQQKPAMQAGNFGPALRSWISQLVRTLGMGQERRYIGNAICCRTSKKGCESGSCG